MDITNIDINFICPTNTHVRVSLKLDGAVFTRDYLLSDIKNLEPDRVEDAVLARLRSHIKENLSGLPLSLIKTDLATRSFKL